MIKKLLLIIILIFISFSNTFADWKTDIDKWNVKPFSEVYPDKQDIYEFKSTKLNDKWEFVVEYTKKHYNELLRAYWWKNILIFDPKNKEKNKLNTKIKFKWDSVFITILKDDKLDLVYDLYIYNRSNLDFYVFTNFFWVNWSDELSFNYIKKEWLFLKYVKEWKFGEINSLFRTYEREKLWVHNWKLILSYWNSNNKYYSYLTNKYKKYIFTWKNWTQYIWFPIKNKNTIINFLKDSFYYEHLLFHNIREKNIEKQKLIISDSDLIISYKFLDLFVSFKKWNRSFGLICRTKNDLWGEKEWCSISNRLEWNYNKNNISNIDFKQFQYKNYFNISKLLNHIQWLWYLKGYSIKDIFQISILNINELGIEYYFRIQEEDILPIVNSIKSPKNISTNPYLISVNFILALLYLLAFYFTTQLFNSYFEELASKKNWNKKIWDLSVKYIKLPFQKLYNYLIILSKNKKNNKLKLYTNKIKNFLKKYEHQIFIILGLLLLWIIGQIVVDDFDLLSLRWWFTIIIMIFILAFITIFKDLLLYIFNKKEEKNKLKLENIPLWFIFAGVVAVFWRWIWLIPWVMFGSVIKLNPKSGRTDRKLTRPKILFKILIIVFLVWLACWFLTIPFDSNSFIYKFLLVTYFWLINDVFFALLPFGMLWWIYILKDKKLKIKWFILTFVIFFFLLHTIMNSDWDLNKLLQFDWNFSILILILIFWMIITGGLYYKTKKLTSK